MPGADGAIGVALDVDHAAIAHKDLLAAAHRTERADGDVALGVAEARAERLAAFADGIGSESHMATQKITGPGVVLPDCHRLPIPFQITDLLYGDRSERFIGENLAADAVDSIVE